MIVIDPLSKRSQVIGIVSAGIGCALPKLPGLYTRVTSYLDWIEEMIRLENYNSTTVINTTTPTPTTTTTESTSNLTTINSFSSTDQANNISGILNQTLTDIGHTTMKPTKTILSLWRYFF